MAHNRCPAVELNRKVDSAQRMSLPEESAQIGNSYQAQAGHQIPTPASLQGPQSQGFLQTAASPAPNEARLEVADMMHYFRYTHQSEDPNGRPPRS